MSPSARLCLPVLLAGFGAGACGGEQFTGESAGAGGVATGGAAGVAGAGAGGTAGAGGVASTCPVGGLESVTEDFSASLDTAKWESYVNTKGTVEASGNELLLRPGLDAAHYVGIYTAISFSLDACATWVEVRQVIDVPFQGDTYFNVRLNTEADAEIGVTPHSNSPSGLGVYFDVREGLNHLSLDMDYDATTHRWWRIRFPVGYVAFDTSPDGKVWTERHTAPRPANASAGTIELGSGTWSGNATQPAAIMDNLNVLPP